MIRSDLRRSGKPNFTGKALLDLLRNNKVYIDRFVSILKFDHKLPYDVKIMSIGKSQRVNLNLTKTPQNRVLDSLNSKSLKGGVLDPLNSKEFNGSNTPL